MKNKLDISSKAFGYLVLFHFTENFPFPLKAISIYLDTNWQT